MCCGWPIAEKVTRGRGHLGPPPYREGGHHLHLGNHGSLGIVLYSPGFASSLNDGASKTSQIGSAVVG